jgi:hypothetical protein
MLYGVASDAGTKMGIRTFEMVICAGDEPVSVMLGGNGNLVTPTAAFVVDDFWLCAAPARLSNRVISITYQALTPPHTAQPQALGPSFTTLKNGASAMPGLGLVCKDTAA